MYAMPVENWKSSAQYKHARSSFIPSLRLKQYTADIRSSLTGSRCDDNSPHMSTIGPFNASIDDAINLRYYRFSRLMTRPLRLFYPTMVVGNKPSSTGELFANLRRLTAD
jgi:hypothetical protein